MRLSPLTCAEKITCQIGALQTDHLYYLYETLESSDHFMHASNVMSFLDPLSLSLAPLSRLPKSL